LWRKDSPFHIEDDDRQSQGVLGKIEVEVWGPAGRVLIVRYGSLAGELGARRGGGGKCLRVEAGSKKVSRRRGFVWVQPSR